MCERRWKVASFAHTHALGTTGGLRQRGAIQLQDIPKRLFEIRSDSIMGRVANVKRAHGEQAHRRVVHKAPRKIHITRVVSGFDVLRVVEQEGGECAHAP
jgi:hypothetical protein